MAPELTITETTMADFAGLRLGVGNVWDAEFTGADGKPTSGPTAMVSFAAPDGRDLHRERVHKGSHVTVSGQTFEIRNVNAPPEGLGSITVSTMPAALPAPTSGEQGKP